MEYLETNGSYRVVQLFFGVSNSMFLEQEQLFPVASDTENLEDGVP